MANQQFEAWQDDDGVIFATSQSIADQRSRGLLGSIAKHLYTIEAQTWEEASAIHYLRMGFEPYKPAGLATPCPSCGALLYAEGSGQCWRCDQVA